MSKSRSLVLIRGLSGSGKTWLAESLVGDSDFRVMICADDFFISEDGEYEFDHTRIKEAHEWCISETKELISDEEIEMICVHNNFSRKWEAEPYFNMAKECGIDVQVVTLYDSGMNDRALSERSPHNISEKAVQKQRHQWELDVHPHRNSKPKRPQKMNQNARYLVFYDEAPQYHHNQYPQKRRSNKNY